MKWSECVINVTYEKYIDNIVIQKTVNKEPLGRRRCILDDTVHSESHCALTNGVGSDAHKHLYGPEPKLN
jgi:hypothetical protein